MKIEPVYPPPHIQEYSITYRTQHPIPQDTLLNSFQVQQMTYTVSIYSQNGLEKTYTNTQKIHVIV